MSGFLETVGLGAAEVIAIVSVVVAALSLLWAAYTHISSRKHADLLYEVSQLADVDVPQEIFDGIRQAPVLLEIQSAGNKKIENIKVSIKTKNSITRFDSVLSGLLTKQDELTLGLRSDGLNPTEKIKIVLFCQGNPAVDQIADLSITHSEGVAKNRRAKDFAMSINLPGLSLDYFLHTGAMHLKRLGLFHFS